MVVAARNNPPVVLPDRRRLRTFAFDPMSTRLSGRFLRVDVPFEGVAPGPIGELVEVVDYDATRDVWYEPVDLDDPAILAQDGLRPIEGDPRTHQQVVYAVATSVIERFERFLGRRFRWTGDTKLRLVPHAFEGRNAFFDPTRRAVLFGYFRADRRDPGENLPGQVMFTCLSTDIVAHEVAHALVHRLRSQYSEATNVDVFAFHEAFADLIALFQHFVHRDVVLDEMARSRGDLGQGTALFDLAQEFGRSTGRAAALRSALKSEPDPAGFQASVEPHARGAHFVAGVFEAYSAVYRARIADLLRIATGGTGELPPGSLHPDLVSRVADEAVKQAERMLGMVIRAFDYLPVVDVTFGDVVRAIVTADVALHPDDTQHLRSRLVEALRRRGIYPSGVASLTAEALVWPRSSTGLTLDEEGVDLPGIILSSTQNLDPSSRPSGLGLDAFAGGLQQWGRRHALKLGLDPDAPIQLRGVHVAYREAADRQPRPEVVVQFGQRRRDLEDASLDPEKRPIFRAGSTVIARVDGRVEHVVAKPLPFAAEVPADAPPVVHDHAKAGAERLAALRRWLGDVADRDALSAWTLEPALHRMTFANLHAGIDEGGA
jgi:hypothetical protein